MAQLPKCIQIRGARVHNLKNVDVDVPLHALVGVCGLSGSGKSSLALGVLYAEGSRRYLEALSAYTRRRLTQASEADVDSIEHIPAALALHQRPAVPGVRSTFGTMSELLNVLRLMMSRLASHACPNGHLVPPSTNVALDKELTCPVCGATFIPPAAQDFSFNSTGACPSCDGTGVVRTVNQASLVPDPSLTIDEGAVAPWNTLMWSIMKDVCRAMGVRTDVPFNQLTEHEKNIVLHGPAEKKHILYTSEKRSQVTELNFTFYNANATVENALEKVKDERGMKRVERFLTEGPCPDCHGTRLNARARASVLNGKTLPQICEMTLSALQPWVQHLPQTMPQDMQTMAKALCEQFALTSRRLLELGLGYLAIDRRGSTLSTGERQRVQLARAVRDMTTGVLYVLDEPSIGLHPANVDGLLHVVRDLVDEGNSVVLVDHDTQVLREADSLIEMGPEAGANGGRVLAQGSASVLEQDPDSKIGRFLSGEYEVRVRPQVEAAHVFDDGAFALQTAPLHTVHALDVRFPKERLVAVTGVSGSGKTTMVLESLVPALQAEIERAALPEHVKHLEAGGIDTVHMIDATPSGANVRSTVATYCGVMDVLRKLFAKTDDAKRLKLGAGDFSYNTGSLRCPTCDGTGTIVLDVQFLPDVQIVCPDCRGSRYGKQADAIRWHAHKGNASCTLPELMAMSVDDAMKTMHSLPSVRNRLKTLSDLGLGYLTVGEATPALSGGEAQRLKLASQMGRSQKNALFVFDEPTIGLHPLDVRTLIGVFQQLIDAQASVIVIEHDLDLIANADYVIDMGPGGGEEGGRIVATGTPRQIAGDKHSLTGTYLAQTLAHTQAEKERRNVK